MPGSSDAHRDGEAARYGPHSPRAKRVATRRQTIMDDLRRHPLSSTPEISDRILGETGGRWDATNAVYISQQTVYADLVALEKQGKVWRYSDSSSSRAHAWQVAA